MTDWRVHAACKGSTRLFFPPCTHYRQPEGKPCELCGTVVERTNNDGEKWNPKHAAAICATCPVQLECLTEAINNGEQHGIWGGAGGYVLRILTRTRRRTNHPYRPACDCEACELMTAHLAGETIDGNTAGITHGLPGNRGRGCRCALCVLSGTITGQLLLAVGWTITDWWATTGLPDDPDATPDVQADRVDRARRVFAHRVAARIRDRLDALDRDVTWLARNVHGTPGLGPDRVAIIAGYRNTTEPFAPHLNPKRARIIADALDINLADLVGRPGKDGQHAA